MSCACVGAEANTRLLPQAMEDKVFFPIWGIVMCITLMLMAMAPVPLVFALRYFNVLQGDGGANRPAVSYTKGRIIQESVPPGEGDDASLLHGKTPADTPSTPPPAGKGIYCMQGGGEGGTEPDTAPNGRYGIGYTASDLPNMSESDL